MNKQYKYIKKATKKKKHKKKTLTKKHQKKPLSETDTSPSKNYDDGKKGSWPITRKLCSERVRAT